jgi:hypothetical protein
MHISEVNASGVPQELAQSITGSAGRAAGGLLITVGHLALDRPPTRPNLTARISMPV